MTAANVATSAISLPSRMNDEADRGEHRGLADAVEGRVEERAEHRALARRARERAVEDVRDRPDDEERRRRARRRATRSAPRSRRARRPRDRARRRRASACPGVSFVFATPRIERARISRAACVYSCLTRSSWLDRGGLLARGRPVLFAHARWARSVRSSCRRTSAGEDRDENPATTSSQ